MSRNCRFTAAVHVCAVLANNPETDVTSDYVASSLNTNPVVVRRLLASLAQAGLVASKRGSGGGYRLAKSAARIDLATIATAVEDDEGPVFAPNPPNPMCPIGRNIQPVVAAAIARAEAARMTELGKVSLADVMEKLPV